MHLDSASVVRALFERLPRDCEAKLRDALQHPSQLQPLERARQKQRETLQRHRASELAFRDNARYPSFRLTHQNEEIHCQLVDEVYDEQGRWRRASGGLHCRYDGQPFEGVPIAMPLGFSTRQQTYRVAGVFCSLACCSAHILTHQLDEHVRQARLALLRGMAAKYFGQQGTIVPALPLEALAIHGGHMSIEVWREAAQSKHHTLLAEPPLEPYDRLVIERVQDFENRKRRHEYYYGRNEEERQQKEQERQTKLENDVQQASVREGRRFRRKVQQGANTLFASMGITIVE